MGRECGVVERGGEGVSVEREGVEWAWGGKECSGEGRSSRVGREEWGGKGKWSAVERRRRSRVGREGVGWGGKEWSGGGKE